MKEERYEEAQQSYTGKIVSDQSSIESGCLTSQHVGWFALLFCLITSTSCSLKTGLYDLDNYNRPLGIHEEPFRYWEGEIHTPRVVADHVDVTLGIGYNSGKDEGRIEVDEYGRWPEVETYMWDFHLGARVFPLGVRDQSIVPYIGGGIGYFEYDMITNTPDGDIDYDWFYDRYGIERHHDTLAHGYFNYLSTGLYIPLHKNVMLQLEFRHDFDKEYKRYDLSGHQVTVGFSLMQE